MTPMFVRYRRRWAVLAVFSLLSGANAMLWISYAPWALKASQFWNVSPQWINALSLVYMLVFIVLLLPATAFVHRFGIQRAVFLSTLLNTVGAWLRFIGAGSGTLNFFLWQLPGQTLAALAQTFLLGAPARVSQAWFAPHERTRSTAIAALCNQAGIGVGFVLPALLIRESGGSGGVNDEGGGGAEASSVWWFMLVEAVVCSIAAALVLLLFREKPKTPPSASTCDIQDRESESEGSVAEFVGSLRVLFRMWAFQLLLAGFGIGVGSFYAVSTLLEQLIVPAGFTSQDAGWLGCVLVTVGIGAALGVSWFADRSKQFRLLLFLSFAGLLASLLWFSAQAARKPKNWPSILACCSVMGAFSSALLPLAFEVAAEMTFPVSAEVSSNVILAAAQVCGILLTLGTSAIAPSTGGIQNASFLLSGGVAVALLLMAFFKPRLARLEVEQVSQRSSLHSHSGVSLDSERTDILDTRDSI